MSRHTQVLGTEVGIVVVGIKDLYVLDVRKETTSDSIKESSIPTVFLGDVLTPSPKPVKNIENPK